MGAVDQRRTLRSDGRRARRSIEGADRRDRTARLVGHLATLHQVERADTVGVYIADDGEPDLADAVEMLRARGQAVALPVPDEVASRRSMSFRRWHANDRLESGLLDIPQPPDGADRRVIPDVVVVPLVRFDRYGNRLGRGAGFYDRWLGTHRPVTVGVAFEVQRASSLPTESHDVPLDNIVTELGIRVTAHRISDQSSHGGLGRGKDGVSCE